VRLEPDLAAVCPRTPDSRVICEGAENVMVGGGEVFILAANPVRRQISDLGKGVFLESEDDVADEFG
jgi:hypothetical protein